MTLVVLQQPLEEQNTDITTDTKTAFHKAQHEYFNNIMSTTMQNSTAEEPGLIDLADFAAMSLDYFPHQQQYFYDDDDDSQDDDCSSTGNLSDAEDLPSVTGTDGSTTTRRSTSSSSSSRWRHVSFVDKPQINEIPEVPLADYACLYYGECEIQAMRNANMNITPEEEEHVPVVGFKDQPEICTIPKHSLKDYPVLYYGCCELQEMMNEYKKEQKQQEGNEDGYLPNNQSYMFQVW